MTNNSDGNGVGVVLGFVGFGPPLEYTQNMPSADRSFAAKTQPS